MEEWMIGAAVAMSGYALNYGARAYNFLRPRPEAITATEANPTKQTEATTSPEKSTPEKNKTSTPTKKSKPSSKLDQNNDDDDESDVTDSSFNKVLNSSISVSKIYDDIQDYENKIEGSKLRRSESLLNRSKPNISSKKISSDRQRETNSLNTSKLNLPLRNHNLSNLAAQKKRHFSSSSSICTSFSMNNSNILNRTASSIAPSTSMNSFIG